MKRGNLIGIVILTFSLSLFFVASIAKAETPEGEKKSLAEILNLKTASLIQKSDAQTETAGEGKTAEQVSISLNQELGAFVDFKSPYPREIETKRSRDDRRAVIGFHFLIP